MSFKIMVPIVEIIGFCFKVNKNQKATIWFEKHS